MVQQFFFPFVIATFFTVIAGLHTSVLTRHPVALCPARKILLRVRQFFSYIMHINPPLMVSLSNHLALSFKKTPNKKFTYKYLKGEIT